MARRKSEQGPLSLGRISAYLHGMRFWLSLVLFWPMTAAADCVILLHGLARTEASFALMEQVLLSRGHQVVRPGYPSTDLPIPDLAASTVPQAIGQCGEETAHFIAHSMGGILVRYWLQGARPENLGRVVMLGPPNQGSQLVDELGDLEVFGLLNGPAGMQLGTGPASVPRRLPPVDYPVGVIAGRNTISPLFSTLIDGPDDGKVAVSETRVDGMRDHLVLPVTHTFMMNNPRVIAQSLHFLEFGRFNPDISWLDSVMGTIEETCPDQVCETGPAEGADQ